MVQLILVILSFPSAVKYLESLPEKTDPLDIVAWDLLCRRKVMERAAAAMEKKFEKGAEFVNGVDRGGRKTRIKKDGDLFLIEGADGGWYQVAESVWVWAMVEVEKLLRKKKVI